MRNRTLSNYRQPAIVIEKLQYPIFDKSQNTGSQSSTSPLIYEWAFWMITISSLPIFMIHADLKNIVALFLTSSAIFRR